MMQFVPTSVYAAPIDTAIWTNSSPIAGGDPLQPPRAQMNFHTVTAPLHQVSELNASVGFVEPSGDTSALSNSPLYYSSTPAYPVHQPYNPIYTSTYNDYSVNQSPFPQSGSSLYSSPTFGNSSIAPSRADIETTFWNAPTIVQPQEEILREIMEECEEIRRRSPHSSHSSSSSVIALSPLSAPSSISDDSSDSTRSSPGPISSSTVRPSRKERKKMQNRVAATRYREKKRKEKEETRGVMEDLEKRNSELREKANKIEKEINILKNLAKEMGVDESRLSPSS